MFKGLSMPFRPGCFRRPHVTETYLFGPKAYLIWKEGQKGLNFLHGPGNFCNSMPLVGLCQCIIALDR